MSLLSKVEIKHRREEMLSLSQVKESIFVFIVLIKIHGYILAPFLKLSLLHLSHPLLIVVKDDGHQHIEQEHDGKEYEQEEEQSRVPIVPIRKVHIEWVRLCGEEDNARPIRLSRVQELVFTFECRIEDNLGSHRPVENEDEDDGEHCHGILYVQ